MSKKLNMKAIANEVSGAMLEGATDSQIDAALFNAYPSLAGKSAYNKNGDYVEGSSYKGFLVGMARERMPRGSQKYFQGLAKNFLQTASFYQAKKINALLISANRDIPYDDVLDVLDQEEEQFKEMYPDDSSAAEFGGVFTPAPVAAGNMFMKLVGRIPIIGKLLAPRVGDTAGNVMKETLKAGPAGAMEAPLWTAGDSRSVDEFKQRVIPEAITAGAGSAVLTPPMMGVGAGLRKGVQAVNKKYSPTVPEGSKPADNEAGLSVLAQQMEEAGIPPEKIQEELNKRMSLVEPELKENALMMDVFGRPYTTATKNTLSMGGKGQSKGIDNLEPFFKSQVERLQKISSNVLTDSPSVAKFREKIENKRKAFGNVYNKLWFKTNKNGKKKRIVIPPTLTVKGADDLQHSLEEILDPNRPTVQLAMKNSQALADEKRIIIPNHATGYDAQHLHFIKMGYDEALSKFGEEGLAGAMRAEAVQNQRNLIKFMGKHIDGYDSARKNYAEPVSESRAFNEGFNALKNSQQVDRVPEMIEADISDFQGHELEAYKMGASRYIEHFIESGMNPRSRTDKAGKLSQFTLVQKIKNIFGEEPGKRFNNIMNQHSEMASKRNIVDPFQGSQTQLSQEGKAMYDFSGEGTTVPLSGREAFTNLNRPDPAAAQRVSSGAKSANVDRLTLPGNLLETSSDIQKFQRLKNLQGGIDNVRRGAVPGLMGSQSEDVKDLYNNRR